MHNVSNMGLCYNGSMKKYLIQIAKDAIEEELTGKKVIDKEVLLKEHPELGKQWATFVTLEEDKRLRGCIGSLVSHRTLLEDVISNAKSAAFKDVRFNPVNIAEFEKLSVEVSLLSAPSKVDYKDVNDLKSKIVVGEDGVILRLEGRQATFLPQVWDQLPSFEAFFSYLCQKADLPQGCVNLNPEIFIYRVEKIKE